MPNKSGKEWSSSDKSKLKTLAKKGTSTSSIANQLGRSQDAVYNKASELKVSLKPKDK